MDQKETCLTLRRKFSYKFIDQIYCPTAIKNEMMAFIFIVTDHDLLNKFVPLNLSSYFGDVAQVNLPYMCDKLAKGLEG